MPSIESAQPPLLLAPNGRSQHISLLPLAFAFCLILSVPNLFAQENRGGEIVANLATGRIIFCVTHDAIIVAATSGGGEIGSRPPAVLPVSPGRIGILLGAIDWTAPDSGKVTRLDAELPAAAANALRRPKQKPAEEPSEIEDIGVAMLEQIRPLIDQVHHKLDLTADEPLVEMILVDYVQDYGPEIWNLEYRVRQENLGNDFWQTRILRPAYVQLYPPEKGQPHTFIEADYPAAISQLQLAERVARPDPQIDRLTHSSREISEAVTLIAAGNSTKARPSPTSDFMRAAIPLAGGNEQNLVMAQLDMNRGFQWVIPPQEPIPAGKTQSQPGQPQPSEPEAPSLRKRGPRPN